MNQKHRRQRRPNPPLREKGCEGPTAPSNNDSAVKTPDDEPDAPLPGITVDAFAGELEGILKPFEDEKHIQMNGRSTDTSKPDVITDDRTAVNCVDVFETVYFQTNEKVLLKKVVGIINRTIAVNFAVILTCSSSKPDFVQVDEVIIDTGKPVCERKNHAV